MSRNAVSDTAVRPARPGAIRTCVGCRRAFMKSQLVRFVHSGDRIQLDLPARHPGRGCYVCQSPECLEKALAKDAARLRRALRLGGIRATVDGEAVRAAWPRAQRCPTGRAASET